MRRLPIYVTIPLVIICCLGLPGPQLVQGGMDLEGYFAAQGLQAQVGFYPIIVIAVVKEVDEGRANTNGEPPQLVLEVLEVLKAEFRSGRPDLRPGRTETFWLPQPSAELSGMDTPMPGMDERIRQWQEAPNPPPDVGSKWILGGYLDPDGRLDVSPYLRIPFTEGELARVREALERLETPTDNL